MRDQIKPRRNFSKLYREALALIERMPLEMQAEIREATDPDRIFDNWHATIWVPRGLMRTTVVSEMPAAPEAPAEDSEPIPEDWSGNFLDLI